MAGSALLDVFAVLQAAELKPGMHVADFGAGRTGHLVLPMSAHVGEEGMVYAVDIHPEVLSMLEGHRSLWTIPHLSVIRGDFERFGGVANIPQHSLDRIFLVNTLWMTRRFASIVAEMRRLLAPHGRMIIVDWEPRSRHVVAPQASLRVDPRSADRLFTEGGCQICGSFQPSPHHWGRIYSH